MLDISLNERLANFVKVMLKVVREDAVLEFSQDQMTSKVVDTGHVAMVQLTVDKAAFERYDVDEQVFGIELNTLEEYLRIMKPDQFLEMTHEESTNQATLTILGNHVGMQTIDPASIPNPDLPKIEDKLTCRVRISGDDLVETMKYAAASGDLIKFTMNETKFSVHVNKVGINYRRDFAEEELRGLDCGQAATSQFSIDYLKPLNSILAKVDEVNIAFGENLPMLMEFSELDGTVSVKYLLAPRITDS